MNSTSHARFITLCTLAWAYLIPSELFGHDQITGRFQSWLQDTTIAMASILDSEKCIKTITDFKKQMPPWVNGIPIDMIDSIALDQAYYDLEGLNDEHFPGFHPLNYHPLFRSAEGKECKTELENYFRNHENSIRITGEKEHIRSIIFQLYRKQNTAELKEFRDEFKAIFSSYFKPKKFKILTSNEMRTQMPPPPPPPSTCDSKPQSVAEPTINNFNSRIVPVCNKVAQPRYISDSALLAEFNTNGSEEDVALEVGADLGPLLTRSHSNFLDQNHADSVNWLDVSEKIAKNHGATTVRKFLVDVTKDHVDLPAGSVKKIISKHFSWGNLNANQINHVLTEYKKLLAPDGKIYFLSTCPGGPNPTDEVMRGMKMMTQDIPIQNADSLGFDSEFISTDTWCGYIMTSRK